MSAAAAVVRCLCCRAAFTPNPSSRARYCSPECWHAVQRVGPHRRIERLLSQVTDEERNAIAAECAAALARVKAAAS